MWRFLLHIFSVHFTLESRANKSSHFTMESHANPINSMRVGRGRGEVLRVNLQLTPACVIEPAVAHILHA